MTCLVLICPSVSIVCNELRPENDKKQQDDLEDDAVSIALEDIVVGEEYEGVINNVVTYGAFVDIGTEVNTNPLPLYM